MRANEFIGESKGSEKLRKSAISSIPNAQLYPELSNSDPYNSYRFGMALAGAPDMDMNKDGPTAQGLLTIGYSPVCDEITNAAAKHFGIKHHGITTKKSTETDTVGTKSPVSNWMNPDKTKKKKK